MEPVGLCGGGLVALILFLVAAVGSAVLAGAIAIALAKLGLTVDTRLKSAARGKPDRGLSDEDRAAHDHPPGT